MSETGVIAYNGSKMLDLEAPTIYLYDGTIATIMLSIGLFGCLISFVIFMIIKRIKIMIERNVI